MPADDDVKINVFKDLLYSEVTQHGSESRLFSQSDLLDLDVIPNGDLSLLVKVINALTADKLLVAVSSGNGLAWRWRSREEAKKFTSFPNDETMLVYSMIDEAGADGIWLRTIKHKLKMHENLVKSAIKYLETKGFIASMVNVEQPTKKMYIKANLKPSDRATGGTWFTDGELDTAFIEELQEVVFEYIKKQSAYLSSHVPMAGGGGATRVPKKGVVRGSAPSSTTAKETTEDATARGTKRPAAEISNDSSPIMQPSALPSRPTPSATPAPPAPSRPTKKVFLPMPAGYKHYPTVPEIAQLIDRSGITNNTTLSEVDVQQLVDVLVFDGRIEPIKVKGQEGYRVTRAVKQDTVPFAKRREANPDFVPGPPPIPNGLMEAPCGRCPVFDICVEGGPVSPSTCVYFPRWLGTKEAPPAAVSSEVAAP